MCSARIHAFTDDALGRHDAVALARLLRRRELNETEVLAAAVARARRVEPALHAIAHAAFDAPVASSRAREGAPFAGVPTFIKDTNDVRGWPTRYGSTAVPTRPAAGHGVVTRELLDQGFSLIGKTVLPEFGLSAVSEFAARESTRNPWHTGYTSGGSSGGAAALVAAGVVPIAHGNDGGGSLRIPASCCGLVGLKLTRGRMVLGEAAQRMPLTIVSEGVLSRSVRDTAHFVAAADRGRRGALRPIGLVEGPDLRRLRIGLVVDSINDMKSCPETRALVEEVARKLAALGHRVEPMIPPVPLTFIDDFKLYWGLLAMGVRRFGTLQFRGFRAQELDPLTQGLARYCERRLGALPGAMARLARSSVQYAAGFEAYDVVLSPVVTHEVPKLGQLHPAIPFDDLFERIIRFSAFTPLNNAAGSPAIAVPAGLTAQGLPMGVHLSGAHGDERTLLALAYELEAELAFPSIEAG